MRPVQINNIFIIQSLEEEDIKTAYQIQKVVKYSVFRLKWEEMDYLVDIESKSDLFDVLAQLGDEAKRGLKPLVHIDMHGSKEGIQTRNGDFIKWEELKPFFLRINTIVENNLFVTIASCYGAYLLNLYQHNEPCPFYGYVGPQEDVLPDNSEVSFTEFFTTLFATRSITAAVIALQKSLPAGSMPYMVMNCEIYWDKLIAMHGEVFRTPREQTQFVKNHVEKLYQRQLSNRVFQKNIIPLESKKSILKRAEKALRDNMGVELFTQWKDVFLHKN